MPYPNFLPIGIHADVNNTPNSTIGWLNATQFLGALNDNLFKFFVIFSLVDRLGEAHTKTITGIAGVVFVVPFLLFSQAAGRLADYRSKQRIIVATKLLEVIVMAAGLLALRSGAPAFLYGILFWMAAQSAIFSPSKYGIIPELVKPDEITRANGLLSTYTFLAIIAGTALAPTVTKLSENDYTTAGLLCLAIAGAGFATSFRIRKTAAQNPLHGDTPRVDHGGWRTLAAILRDRYLRFAVLGNAYFWGLGAYVQLNIIPYGIEAVGLSKEDSAYLFLLVAFGIAVGSFLAGKLSVAVVELGLAPVGAAGMGVLCIALDVLADGSILRSPTAVLYAAQSAAFLLGLCGGLFVIPLIAFVQYRTPSAHRGATIAVTNWTSFTAILGASLLIIGFSHGFGLSAREGFLLVGVTTLILSLLSLVLLPHLAVRLVSLVLSQPNYRIAVVGAENIPIAGPALLVSNHASWADPVVVARACTRPIRFMMFRSYYQVPWLYPVCRMAGAIPIGFNDPPKQLIRSLRQARQALDDGDVVCIFAEGRMTRTGAIDEFMRGLERIVKGTNHPMIPVYIDGTWGSVCSWCYGEPLSRFPALARRRVTIVFGTALPANTSLAVIREKVIALSTARRSRN